MKRDLDLIRTLLVRVEEGKNPALEPIEGYSSEQILYNAALTVEATPPLVVGEVLRHGFGDVLTVSMDRLTWDGHDFLEAARDNTVWKKAKETVLKPGASFTFDLLKEWLKAEIRLRSGGGA